MFDDTYFSRMRSNRALQKNLSSYSSVQLESLEVYISIHDALLEMCEICGLKDTTKYIIKKLIDTFILNFTHASPSDISFASMNFFRMAIKIHEDPSLYDQWTIEKCMEQMGNQFTKEDYIKFEIEFYGNPEFGLTFTTPYDYLGLYESVFPLNRKIRERVIFFLDFSFTVRELMLSSAQQIFFGCMLLAHGRNSIQKRWILSQTYSQEQSKKVSQIISLIYEQQVKAAQNAQFQ